MVRNKIFVSYYNRGLYLQARTDNYLD